MNGEGIEAEAENRELVVSCFVLLLDVFFCVVVGGLLCFISIHIHDMYTGHGYA